MLKLTDFYFLMMLNEFNIVAHARTRGHNHIHVHNVDIQVRTVQYFDIAVGARTLQHSRFALLAAE